MHIAELGSLTYRVGERERERERWLSFLKERSEHLENWKKLWVAEKAYTLATEQPQFDAVHEKSSCVHPPPTPSGRHNISISFVIIFALRCEAKKSCKYLFQVWHKLKNNGYIFQEGGRGYIIAIKLLSFENFTLLLDPFTFIYHMYFLTFFFLLFHAPLYIHNFFLNIVITFWTKMSLQPSKKIFYFKKL